MTSQLTRFTLMQHLAREEVRRLAAKRLFGGGYYVPLLPLFWTGLWLFQKGAILGRARRDRLELLAKMLFQPGSEQNVYWVLNGLATARMEKYGKEPDDFVDFWVRTELPEATAGHLFDVDVLKWLSKRKMRLGEALNKVNSWVLSGIAFGATYPDLTERMWNKFGERRDPASWAEARRAGLDLPEEDTILSLEEMGHTVLAEVADYALEYFPELVEPLGLRLA